MASQQVNHIRGLFPDMSTKEIQEVLKLNNNNIEKSIAAIMVTREGIEGLLGDTATKTTTTTTTTTTKGGDSGEKEDDSAKWACEGCTFLNSLFDVHCAICGAPSPVFKDQIKVITYCIILPFPTYVRDCYRIILYQYRSLLKHQPGGLLSGRNTMDFLRWEKRKLRRLPLM